MQEGYAPLLLVSRGSKLALERSLCDGETPLPRSSASRRLDPRRGADRRRGIARERDLAASTSSRRSSTSSAPGIFERCYDGDLHMVGSGQTWWLIPKYMVDETAKLAYQSVFARGC